MEINNEQLNVIKQKFEESYYTLSESVIIGLNKNWNSGDLNNVIVGLNNEFFGILLKPDETDENYQLIYITYNNELEGHLIELNIHNDFREQLTFYFSQYLSLHYPNLDTLDTFNTFQKQTMSLLEKMDYFTINPEYLKMFGDNNPSVAVPNKKGIKKVTIVSKSDFYKDFFGEIDVKTPADGHKYIYIMINKRNNYFKIGSSKNPYHREKTLQSEEPEIEMISLWYGPVSLERELHKKYNESRKRGEWFKLTLNQLQELRESMKDFK